MFAKAINVAVALLAATLLAPGALADSLEINTKLPVGTCMEGCHEALTTTTFGDTVKLKGATAYYATCTSTYYLQSLILCGQKYCSQASIDAAWPDLEKYCLEYGMTEIPTPAEIAQNLPSNYTVVSTMKASLKPYNNSIIPDEESFTSAYRTLAVWEKQEIYHQSFGWSLILLGGVMITVGTLLRFFSWVTWRGQNFKEPSFRSEMAPSDGKLTRFQTAYKKYIGLPALFGNRHGEPAWFMFSIPTRIQFLWVLLYVVLNIVFTCVGYEAFADNWYWPGRRDHQLVRYLADRTGIMAFWNMPLLWLLGGRNDIAIWLTGVSFSTMNLYHRWVARIAVIQAVVHSAAYTWEILSISGTLKEYWAEAYWRYGVFATIIWCLMIPMSILPMRKYQYEIFLIFHILAAAFSLFTLWKHVDIFDREYNPFFWTCIGLWAFDRGLRWVRLSVLSWNAIRDDNAEAIVTGGENSLIRLTVNVPFGFTPAAGSYYFIYSAASLTPWENHPFTLASWETVKGQTKLHFLIAVQSGATRRLCRRIKQSPTRMRILLEGPYGHTEPVERFEHVLLVAGGSGITAILPYLVHLKDNSFTKTISVIWSVKNNAYTTNVMEKELSNCGADVTIHITEEDQPAGAVLPAIGQTAIAENKEKAPSSDQGSSAPGISVIIGRADFEKEIYFHAGRLLGSERLAVLACGPGGMMDDIRKTIVKSVGNGEGQIRGNAIEYFEELFSW